MPSTEAQRDLLGNYPPLWRVEAQPFVWHLCSLVVGNEAVFEVSLMYDCSEDSCELW